MNSADNNYYEHVTDQNFKELNVTPFKVQFIKDIEENSNDITIFAVILEIQQPFKTKNDRELQVIKVSDATAQINLVVWDGLANELESGDIIKVTKLYASIFKNCLSLYTSRIGEFIKLGEFTFVYNDKIDKSIAVTPTVSSSSSYSDTNFGGVPTISSRTQSNTTYSGSGSSRRDVRTNNLSNKTLSKHSNPIRKRQ